VQSNLATLASVVAAKVSVAELQNGSLGLNIASVTASGELRASTLDISGNTLANTITASTIDALNVTSRVGSFGHFSSDLIFDDSSTLHLVYSDEPYAVRIGNTAARVGINCEVAASSGLSLDVVGGARFSGNLTAGATVINSGDSENSLICGSSQSFLRLKNGHHIDVYNRDGTGRDLNMCMHTLGAVRLGQKLAIGMPSSNFQLQLAGAANLTSFIEATKFQIGSDQRLKENIQAADLGECTRLIQAVRPMTYLLKSTGQAQLGYRAQDFERESQEAYRNSIVGESLGDEKFLALDYSRVVPVLHGALLSALARIEALESRLQ
jgi:hypothetical protein